MRKVRASRSVQADRVHFRFLRTVSGSPNPREADPVGREIILRQRGEWYFLDGKRFARVKDLERRLQSAKADRNSPFDQVRGRLDQVVARLRQEGLVTEVMSQVIGIENDLQYVEIKLKVPAPVFEDDDRLDPIYAALHGASSDAISVLPSLYPDRRIITGS
jgi:hypothetical protein